MGTLAEAAASLKRTAGSSLPALLLMTDEARLADPLPAANALPAGSGIILRHYGAPERAALARCLAAIARRRGLVLLVGEDPATRAAGRRSRGPSAGARHQARRCRALAAGLADHRRRPFPCGVALSRLRWRRCRSTLPGFRHGEPPRCPRPRPPPLRGAGARQPSPGLCPRRHRQRPRASPARQRRRWNRGHRRAHSSDSSPVRAKCRA